MRVLIDNGVESSSDFLEGTQQVQEQRWGSKSISVNIAGFRRVKALNDPEQQREIDALFTIGRLVRESHLELFTYSELEAEMWRRPRGREPLLNAFGDCRSKSCESALERSKFRMTVNMNEWFAKGDKRDLNKGRPITDFNQVPYFAWLSTLTSAEIQLLTRQAAALRLTDFEVESLHDLTWFQKLFGALGGSEKHLPDCFHIWTARRNKIDVFLSIEKTLPRLIEELKSRRKLGIEINVEVLRPTSLLGLLNISAPDPVPVEFDRYYSYAEIFGLKRELLGN